MSLGESLRKRIVEDLNVRSEPLWREAAYWFVIISFFSLPLVVMVIHIVIFLDHIDYKAHAGEFAYLWSFHKVLAGLLAAMLGLNSWDKRTATRNNNSVTK